MLTYAGHSSRVPMNLAEYLHVTDVSMCDNDLLLLPEALCTMTALQRLDIRRNRLQHLPEAVGAMLDLNDVC